MRILGWLSGKLVASGGASASVQAGQPDAIANMDLMFLVGQAKRGDEQAIERVAGLGASRDAGRRKGQLDAVLQWLVLSAVAGDSKRIVVGGARCHKCGTGHSFTMLNAGEPTAPCTKCATTMPVDWWQLPAIVISVKLSEQQAAELLGGASNATR